jgi:outer membrane protein
MHRPEFQLLRAERRGFEADYRHERAFLFPQLSLNLQYGIDANHVNWKDRGRAAFFTFDIPIFDWLRTRSLAQQARVRAEQVETRREVSIREFARDYQDAEARVRLIYEQITLSDTQAKTSEENLRLARIRFEGEGSALEVVTAQTQRDLATAEGNEMKARTAYARGRYHVSGGDRNDPGSAPYRDRR